MPLFGVVAIATRHVDGISSVLDQPSVVTGTECDLGLTFSCLPCIIIFTELLRRVNVCRSVVGKWQPCITCLYYSQSSRCLSIISTRQESQLTSKKNLYSIAHWLNIYNTRNSILTKYRILWGKCGCEVCIITRKYSHTDCFGWIGSKLTHIFNLWFVLAQSKKKVVL